MVNESREPYHLDWGAITPEGYNKETKELLHVFNIDVSSRDNIQRCTVFIIGRIAWFNMQAPAGSSQKIVLDLRGQALTLLDRARKMKAEIIEGSTTLNPSLQLIIEILI
jgi:hypothetical protein